jgi:hypothetical protein
MITTTEKKQLRHKMIQACIAKQQFLIDDFKERIKDLTLKETPVSNEPYDQKDIAAVAASVTELETLTTQLAFANEELALLETLQRSEHIDREQVAFGAIVITNHYTFFISASLEKFIVDGHVYIGISVQSPIYKTMEGKVKGDTFSFNSIHYNIKDIF